MNVPFPVTKTNKKRIIMWRKRSVYCKLLVALAFAGCVEHDAVKDGGNAGAIRFSSESSRAAITEDNPMTSFKVWGYYAKDGGNSTNDVFGVDGQEVSGSSSTGEWTYFPAQYWVLGATYEFHALYPADTKRVVETFEDGSGHYLRIYLFDATKGTDLMMASVSGIRHETAQDVEPVALTFHHLLARVEFVGRAHDASAGIAGFVPKVHSAKLYGMNREANFSAHGVNPENAESVKAGWSVQDTPSVAGSPFVAYEGEGLELDVAGKSIFGDVLIFPQDITRDYMLEITYSTDVAGADTHTQTIPLSTMAVTEWEAGMYYRYTFTVSDDERILFDVPTVAPWDEASGGIIIVD